MLLRPFLITAVLIALSLPATAQEWSPLKRGSDNIEVLGHLPLGPAQSVADMDVEQELDRPYAYVARMVYGERGPKGLDIISIADPEKPELLYEWRIEDQELHQRTGGMEATPNFSKLRLPLRLTSFRIATTRSPSRMCTCRSVAAEPVVARKMKRSITSLRPSSITGISGS